MRATRLREVSYGASHGGPVIDVSYSRVPERKTLTERKFWRALKRQFLAVLCAAAIGFMLPPLWVVAQQIWPTLGAN
jgi:hypothetical protein